jgi:hypothetical protein
LVRWFVRCFVGWFVGSSVPWLVGSFVRSLIGSFVGWFVVSLVGWFVRSSVRSSVRWVLAERNACHSHIPCLLSKPTRLRMAPDYEISHNCRNSK